MARPGVGIERIVEVIRELDTSGKEVTVTAVRERLGTGSYSTIGSVVADWRREKANGVRPATPEPSEGVRVAFSHAWAEAWKAAMAVHEPERQIFARERQEHERAKAEILAEIARLEAELEGEKENATRTAFALTAERDGCRDELQSVRAALAASEGALGEARKQVDHEGERNRQLSERVIAEAALAQALAARVEELQSR